MPANRRHFLQALGAAGVGTAAANAAQVTTPLRAKNIGNSGAYLNGLLGNPASWREVILANPALFTTTDDLDHFVQALRPILRAAKKNG